MDTCDWCGNIQTKGIMAHHPEFDKLRVCYDCLVEIYNSIFPPMRFKDSALMTANLMYKHFGKEDKIYIGYLRA